MPKKLQRPWLLRKRRPFFTKLGRMLEDHATGPWCESYIDLTLSGAVERSQKCRFKQAYLNISQFCTYVHPSIPNKFPIRTYSISSTHYIFCKLHLHENAYKNTVQFLAPSSVEIKDLLSHTVAAITYAHMWLNFKQCFKRCSQADMEVCGSTYNPLISCYETLRND